MSALESPPPALPSPGRPPFVRRGPQRPESPVVLAVPHAGRDYPPALLAAARVSPAQLEALEDRYADRLIDAAVAAGTTAFVAARPRSWIDLNRDEREIDPILIAPPPRPQDLLASAKVRGGLGLLPRRLAGVGELWRGRLPAAELAARIAQDHRPWHAALAAALADARARFGAALLIDCHSMPPLPARGARRPAQVVLGDRHGRSAPALLIDRLAALVEEAGLVCARNMPYAGGHTLDRQAAPREAIFAIQIEIDRSLYLGPDLRDPGEGLARMQALLAAMVAAMADELLIPLSRAAE